MKKIIDSATDTLEKVASPASRSGSSVERVGKLLEANVSPNVIALQMTENSPNSQKYTTQDIESYGKLYTDSKTRVVVTAKQTRALIDDMTIEGDFCPI
ncbi:hypothetical protein HW932_01525 [Allochromatium humboldtianum]|uniref:Uncharacterized protein n=1 Tax=Allochromatium humboldtianum TaxID=504901 RepID=A0A850RE50_9GAMM|nr:hypothetical protein [Allochromatium humboldtianum]NVZ07941.1 hypothetical protein [Allochromatium humboldtianum]